MFFDEANTTSALGLIAEAVLSRTVMGLPINAPHLHFALALNPCKKHTAEAIHKLENAGLGYHVQDLELLQKFDDGSVPLRQLVYRVNPLPPSLVPLVWDFGFLSIETEDLYIHQMINRRFVSRLASCSRSQFEDGGSQVRAQRRRAQQSGGYQAEMTVTDEESRVLTKILCAAQHFRKVSFSRLCSLGLSHSGFVRIWRASRAS